MGLALVAALCVNTLPAFAGKSINARQHHQRDRIHQGVESGSLTRLETKRLVGMEKRFHRKEQQYRSDGILTPRERYDLQTDLNRMSRKIYIQKHDDQTRPQQD